MIAKNEIIFLIKQMVGGGAERIVALLSAAFTAKGHNVTIIMTHCLLKEADLSHVADDVKVLSLPEALRNVPSYRIRKFGNKALRKAERLLPHGRSKQRIRMYKVRNYDKYLWLKKYFAAHQDATLIAFLNDSIFLTLLSAGKNNRVIISERGDPRQTVSSKVNPAFYDLMYKKADHMVFQSPDARQWYRDRCGLDGVVIFNPVTPNLPQPYHGERQKKIVDFCRISSQKNLHLLIEAFDKFYQKHPDYELYIYGDSVGNGAAGYIESVRQLVAQKNCKQAVHILPAIKNIHTEIRDYAMFVSSSDYEGMSNSMLEAMAIGLPVVCTDCPAGGARAVIRDRENGILTPVGDADALAQALCEIAEDFESAEKLSVNGVKIREQLSINKIIDQWMEIINDQGICHHTDL